MMFVRYFSQAQRTYWNEGQEPSLDDVINDIVSVELEHFEKFAEVGQEAEATIGDMAEDGSPFGSVLEAARSLETPQATGSGLVVFVDSMERLAYARRVRLNAQTAVIEIGEAARLEDYARVEQIARQASAYRNTERLRAQTNLSPSGRILSEAIEGPRDWDYMSRRYKGNLERIAERSGHTRTSVLWLGRIGAVAGPAAAIYSTRESFHRIGEAAPEDRDNVALEEGGGAVGGTLGSMLGSAAGTGVGIAISTLLGSNPILWTVIGLSVIGGGFGGFAGSELGRAAGGMVGEALDTAAEHVSEASEHFMWRVLRGRW